MAGRLSRSGTTGGTAHALSRIVTCWLVVFGLLVQGAAMAAPMGSSMGMGDASSGGAFPICHAQGSEDLASQPGDTGPVPAHHDGACPFCSICTPVAALPPTALDLTARVGAKITSNFRALAALVAEPVVASAWPRGPPARA